MYGARYGSQGIVDDVDYMFGRHIGFKPQNRFWSADGKFSATTKLDAVFPKVRSSHAGAAPERDGMPFLAAAASCMCAALYFPSWAGASRIM